MLYKLRIYVALDIQQAMRMRLINLSGDTIQFENAKLPKKKKKRGRSAPLPNSTAVRSPNFTKQSHEGVSYGAYRISP